MKPKEMTDVQIVAALQSELPINHARRQFSNWRGKIEQAGLQRKALSPIDMRRMEFEAVLAIAKELGVEL